MKFKSSMTAMVAAAVLAVGFSAHAQTVLNFTSMSPAGSTNDKFFNEWASRVNTAAKGELKVVIQNGLTRANFGNVYDRVTADVVQIGWAIHSILPGKFTISEVVGLPFVSDKSESGSVAYWRLYKTGMLDSEFSDIVPVWMSNFPAYRVHFSKPPKAVDTLKGETIGVTGKVWGDLVARMGGSAVSMLGSEVYTGLQRGTINGVVLTWAAFAPYKLHEVTSYTLEAPLGSNPASWFMTRKKFDGLTASARTALMSESGEKQSRNIGKYFDTLDNAMRQKAIDSGKYTVNKVKGDVLAKWRNVADQLLKDWLKERPGTTKVLAKYREILADVKAGK